ncbi:MAG: NYN domain-containing protein [Candidatus Promineifilaceae bacterium]|jgi:predicted RNA-binding protein with PIN domain
MHYLIDGHNLIGRMPDIGLEDPDDEVELVLRLRSWAARSRGRRVTVIFDRGLPGGKDRGLSTGKVQVVFASGGQTADALLIKRIQKIKNPREATVVTSDNQILHAAAERRMPALRAEEFAQQLNPSAVSAENESLVNDENAKKPADDRELSDSELEMWLNLFGSQNE